MLVAARCTGAGCIAGALVCILAVFAQLWNESSHKHGYARALALAEVGIAVSEDANLFTPACDAILDSRQFTRLDTFLGLTRKAMGIIRLSLALSLMYNAVGLWFAVTGRLEPVVAAILMPLSSISIVAFTTAATNWIGRKLDRSKTEINARG